MKLSTSLFRIVAYISAALLLIIMPLALSYYYSYRMVFTVFVGLLIITGLIGLWSFLYFRKISIGRPVFLLSLAGVAFVLRLFWVLFIDTVPFSDFLCYHEAAVNASKGDFKTFDLTFVLFPFKLGYPLVLSVVYRVFGASVMVAKLFNVVVSVAVVMMVYRIAGNIFGERAARIAGVLFACWPAQIMYCSVLASEHVFIFFMVLAVLLFFEYGNKSGWAKSYRGYAVLFAAGVMLAVAQMIRPVAVLLIPLLGIYVLLYTGEGVLKNLAQKIKILVLVILGFAVCASTISVSMMKPTGVDLMRSSSGFSLLIGTNYYSKGGFNMEDAAILKEFNYDFDKVHGAATKRAIDRIVSNPGMFVNLATVKFNRQWGDEAYGLDWSARNLEKTNAVSDFITKYFGWFVDISQFYYLILLFFMIAGCLFAIKDSKPQIIVFLIFFLGLVASHTFMEAQARYHMPAMPLLILVAGYGVERCLSKVGVRLGMADYDKKLEA